jgi:hypothetical protein
MNPHPPPMGYGQGYGQVPPRPPGAPKTFGVLSIVFGSLVVVSSLFGLASSGKPMFMPPNMHGSDMLRAFKEFHDATRWVTLIQALMMGGMSIALIIIGTGQLKYRRWAAGASVKWAIAGFVVLAIQFVLNIAIVSPATTKLMEAMADNMPIGTGGFSGMMKVSMFAGLALYAVYPILLIVNFRKPDVVAAMKN